MDQNKKQYRQIELNVYLLTQQDAVRTSNGTEVNYKDQNGWQSSEEGFDKPFEN